MDGNPLNLKNHIVEDGEGNLYQVTQIKILASIVKLDKNLRPVANRDSPIRYDHLMKMREHHLKTRSEGEGET